MGARALRLVGGLLGFVAGTLLGIRRREVEQRLRDAGFDDAARIATDMYRSLGIALAELCATSLAPASMMPRLVLTERAEAALSEVEGQGAVVATAHVANWDLLACSVAQRTRLFVVTKRLSVGVLDRIWHRLRRARGVGLLGVEGSLAASAARVRSGALVAMMIDQAPASRRGAIQHEFLGRPAWHDPSPALVAARTRRPLLIAFSRRLPSGDLELDVPLVLHPDEHSPRAFVAHACRLASRELEIVVRRDPSCWLWLHRRWKDVPARRGGVSARVVRAPA